MDRILVVSSNEKAAAQIVLQLKELYPGARFAMAQTGADARRVSGAGDFDCVVINCPLSDEYGSGLAEMVTAGSAAGCVMLVKNEYADQTAEKAENFGAMVISKPINKQLFFRAMHFVAAARNRMLGIQSENLKLNKKLEEIRLINRAKFALMQYLGFSEQQAHRYLEKQAMDLRESKTQIAEKVIRMYET
ncbi:MAG: ANTAR domain-containing protein [Ruminococcus sp.]|nr:ANTAR domain-containing protein [Ruminococcus sp.]